MAEDKVPESYASDNDDGSFIKDEEEHDVHPFEVCRDALRGSHTYDGPGQRTQSSRRRLRVIPGGSPGQGHAIPSANDTDRTCATAGTLLLRAQAYPSTTKPPSILEAAVLSPWIWLQALMITADDRQFSVNTPVLAAVTCIPRSGNRVRPVPTHHQCTPTQRSSRQRSSRPLSTRQFR